MTKTAREVIAETQIHNDELALAGGPVSTMIVTGIHNADRLLAALDAAGFVIVPKRPTREMCEAAVNLGDEEGDGSVSESDAQIIYEQMIAAASSPSREGE